MVSNFRFGSIAADLDSSMGARTRAGPPPIADLSGAVTWLYRAPAAAGADTAARPRHHFRLVNLIGSPQHSVHFDTLAGARAPQPFARRRQARGVGKTGFADANAAGKITAMSPPSTWVFTGAAPWFCPLTNLVGPYGMTWPV